MSNSPAIDVHLPAAPAGLGAKSLLQLTGASAWFTGSLFLAAGRLDWVRGWISIALWVTGLTLVGLLASHYNPAVMVARSQTIRKDTKHFDKIFWALYFPLVFIQPAIGGLDAVRFRWSSMSFAFVYVGAAALILSMGLTGWVLCVNPFAEKTVRIQTERGQAVVTSGPYRLARHPMYVGSMLMFLGAPLVWGSVWALILGVLMSLLMIWRTSREDETLRKELSGYDEFAKRTRYRLLPGIW
jgi:protein-S-isoprenylcysteine O-methyltransferase Ste14